MVRNEVEFIMTLCRFYSPSPFGLLFVHIVLRHGLCGSHGFFDNYNHTNDIDNKFFRCVFQTHLKNLLSALSLRLQMIIRTIREIRT